MVRPNKRKLQSLIRKTAKASTSAYLTQTALNEYCIEVYGHAPGDIDCDYILDSIYGAAGVSGEISVEEFDTAMKFALEMSGHSSN